MKEDQSNEIDLAEFLEQHSSLFVVLGVFSALAIYISDLGAEPLDTAPLQIRIGFAGALLLSLLILLVIYQEMVNHVGSVEDLFRAHTNFKNWDLMIFTAGAAFLLPSLITPLLRQISTLYYVIGVLSLIFSLPLIFEVVIIIDSRLTEEGIIRYVQIICVSAFTYWASTQYSDYIISNSNLTGVESFSLSNVEPLFYDVTGVIALIAQTLAGILLLSNSFKFVEELGEKVREVTNS
jgi:hypothetical protein